MNKFKRRFLSSSTAFVLFSSFYLGNQYNFNVKEAYASTYDYDLASSVKNGTILHAWNWSFNTIKEKLPEIAKAGYTSVQTSPIQGTKENAMATSKWWLLYQPTNFKIGNAQLGSRDEFKSMCEEAEKYGINIIVDVVANHTANSGSSQYYADSSVDSSIRDNEYFWHEHRGVDNWNDRWQVTHLGIGLPDLNSSNWDLQNMIIAFLNDCIACGADGFRFDAAKHIELPSDPGGSDFWTRVLNSLDRSDIYVYGEVLQGGADNYAAYTDYMDVTASNYGYNVRSAVGYGSSVNVENAKSYSVPSGAEPSELVTWVESHDNYANDDKVSTSMSDYQIKMAWAIIAARAESTPLFFARPAGTTQNSGSMGVVGSTLWEDSDIAEVNKFHNAMEGESEYLRTQGNDIMMVERGTKGMVIVNLGDGEQINTSTKMADGEYIDRISGNTFTVSGGNLSGYSNGYSISVLYKNNENAKVASNKDSCSFVNSIDIVLTEENADRATYSIDGGNEISYSNGTKISLGADKGVGSTIKLTLKGYKDDKIVTKTYTYKKVDVLENPVVYFEKPSNWSTANIYVYDESGSTVKEVASWPGTAMTDDGNGIYKYTLPDGWENAMVIFNDGTNQIPEKEESGFKIALGESKIYEDGQWKDYEDPVKELTISSFNTSKSSPQKTGTSITLSALATGGEGELSYRFSVANDINETTVLSDYSSSNTAQWIPDSVGKYVLLVSVKDESGNVQTSSTTFTISDVSETATAYFEKPSSWSTANIYVYDESGSTVKEVASWPGVSMTNVSGNLYKYTLPEGWEKANVIFTDGSNQVPSTGQTGFQLNSGETKIYKDGSWSDYNVTETTKVYFNNSSNWSTVKVYLYDATVSPKKEIASWPGVSMINEGNGIYSYTLPEGWERANVIFTDGNNQIPASMQPGFEINSGETKIYENGTWSDYNK